MKTRYIAVIALALVLMMSGQNLSPSSDSPTRGIQFVSAAEGTLGNTHQGTGSTDISANDMLGTQITVGASDRQTDTIKFYGRATSGSYEQGKGIITNSALEILLVGDIDVITNSNGWQTIELGSNYTLLASTTYYIAVVVDYATRFYRDNTGNYVNDGTNSFATPTDPSDGEIDVWYDYSMYCITYDPPNTVPVNDQAPTLDNPTDTDNLYAQYIKYQITVYVSDTDGFADIDYLEIGLWDNGRSTEYVRFRYDEDTDTFSEVYDSGTVATIDAGSSTATESGNDIDATFYITVDIDFPDTSDLDAKCYVIDAGTDDDTDWYEVNWDTESRVDVVTFTLDDGSYTSDRGTYDTEDSITATGTLEYYGSNTAVTDFYDVWVSCADIAGSPWSDLTLTAGAFSMTVDSDDVVGLDTYWVHVVDNGAGSAGTKINQTSLSDTYIADVVNVADWASGVVPSYGDYPADAWYNVGSNINVWAGLLYQYDESWVGYGTFLIDGETTSGDGGTGWYANFTYSIITEKKFGLAGALVTGTATTHGVTKFNHTSLYGAQYDDLDLKWTQINISLSLNYGWTVIDNNVTISSTSVWGHDGTSVSPSITYDTGDGSVYPTESTSGMETYTVVSSTESTSGFGITAFAANSVQVTYDTVSISSTSYFWVQYTPESVWFVWQTGTFTWSENTTLWTGAYTIQSHMNTTEDDWAVCDSTGQIGDLIIGQFDTTLYYTLIEVNCEVTVGSRSFDFTIWSNTVQVDILHSIHIEDSGMDVQDSWITFYFHTNWNNATFSIWDNITGTPVEVGYSSTEGWYQIAKPTVTGTHHYYILVNGTHSGATSAGQTCDTSLTSDSWKWREYKFVVNPVMFSIDDLTFQQNNDTIIVSGWFSTPNTTLTWVLKEDGIQTSAGTLQLVASGEYSSVRWTKTDSTLAGNFTLTISADGSDIIINGYSFVIDSSSFIGGSFYKEGDTYYQTAPSDDVAWVVALAIVAVILIPVAIGLGFGIRETMKRRNPKRDKSNDGLYRR